MILIIGLLFIGCQKDASLDSKELAFITTQPYESLNSQGVTLVGEVLDEGQLEISDFGFAWSNGYSGNTIYSLKEAGGSLSNFKHRFSTEFETGRSIRYRAYVKQNQYMVYGNEYSFISKGGIMPQIDNISPNEGYSGTIVDIRGSYFDDDSDNVDVYVGENRANIIQVSKDHIQIVIPNLYQNTYSAIKVQCGWRETVKTNAFKQLLPEVHSISQSTGKPGSLIQVRGENMLQNFDEVEIFLNNLRVEILNYDPSEMTIVVPYRYSSLLSDYSVSTIKLKHGYREYEFPIDLTILKQWEKVGNTPLSAIWNSSSPPISNGFAYVLGTFNSKKVYKFDIINNSWEHISDYPGSFPEYTMVFVHEDKLYKLGGGQYGSYFMLDLNTGIWTEQDPVPFEFQRGRQVIKGDYLYISTDNDEFWRYSFMEDQYLKMQDFPTGPFRPLNLYLKDGVIMAMNREGTWQYQESSDTWTFLFTSPNEDSYIAPVLLLNDRPYVYYSYDDMRRYVEGFNKWVGVTSYPWENVYDYYVTHFVYNDMAYFLVGDQGYFSDTHLYKFTP